MLHRSVAFIVAVFMLCSGFLLPDRTLSSATAIALTDHAHADPTPPQCTVPGLDPYDQPDDLSEPLHADMLQDATALVATPQGVPASAMTLAPPRQWGWAGHRPPFLEGPQRPPCMDQCSSRLSRAGTAPVV